MGVGLGEATKNDGGKQNNMYITNEGFWHRAANMLPAGGGPTRTHCTLWDVSTPQLLQTAG